MSLLTIEELRDVVADGLTDEGLQAVIDREESWLARKIGPLAGERTQTLRPPTGETVLLIQRPTDAVEVSENSAVLAETSYFLRGSAAIERVGATWGALVEVTYEPSDEPEVKRALIELVRGTLSASPNSQENAGGHSTTRMPSLEEWRGQVVRTLEPHRGPFTMRVTR